MSESKATHFCKKINALCISLWFFVPGKGMASCKTELSLEVNGVWKRKSPDKFNVEALLFVGPLGLEPRTTEPKSAVLPITPWVFTSF